MTQHQLLTLLKEIREITGSELTCYQPDGLPKASTADQFSAFSQEDVRQFLKSGEPSLLSSPASLFRLEHNEHLYGALSLDSHTPELAMVGRLAASQLSHALGVGREALDRSTFIRRLLQNEIPAMEILEIASRLHLDAQATRIVYLIETEDPHDTSTCQTIRSLYPENRQNYLSVLDEHHLLLVRPVAANDTEETFLSVAETLVDMLSMENMCNARVSCSSPSSDIRLLSQAFQEAQSSLEIGKIFYFNQKVTVYSSLGIGRLIYQLPLPLCRMYLNEVFTGDFPAIFDDETLALIEKFFENNLNTSETARKLYIHRNTLIYRLDKIQKETGLDVRTFDDALTLKIALLVRCYLRYQEKKN
ncbi:MAG TPA: CdaR family transcriptional regulator [Lachnospiraceae bacterium]|nr:CdaR family transcriptional regulator [Lachnospiraceae bacterium]